MRFAVVDGFSTSHLLVRDLRAHGVSCLHVRSQRVAPASFERSFDPLSYVDQLPYSDDEEEIAARLADLGVERVVTGTESGVTLANALNHRLGFPCNDVATARARRDKSAMTEAVRTAGLAAARSMTTTDPEEAVTWFEEHGGRFVVVKPTMSAGTDNVRVCSTVEQVRRACSVVLSGRDYFGFPNTAAIVQEYLRGTEYIVNTVSVGGVHKVSDVWSSHKRRGPHGAPLYDHQEPQTLTDPVIVRLIDYVRSAVTALGIREGAAHSEVVATERGPVLIETGARLMGTHLPDLSRELSGVSHIDLLGRSLYDPSAFHRYDERTVSWAQRLRYVWLMNDTAGVAGSGAWRERYSALPSYRAMIAAERTDVVPRTTDVSSAPGFVALVADTEAELDRDHRAIRTAEKEGIYLS